MSKIPARMPDFVSSSFLEMRQAGATVVAQPIRTAGRCLSPFLPRSRINGGAYRDRTDDPLLAKQVLSQLS